MQIIKDIIGFIKEISQIDLLLYVAVLVLIILVVSLIYIIKNGEEEDNLLEENNNKEDLKSIVKTIENTKPLVHEFTDYEAEQEEKAIISYEELLEKSKIGTISYEEEKNEDVSIKKINLDTLMEKSQEKKNTCFYNYEREEEFLKSLKVLNQLLN